MGNFFKLLRDLIIGNKGNKEENAIKNKGRVDKKTIKEIEKKINKVFQYQLAVSKEKNGEKVFTFKGDAMELEFKNGQGVLIYKGEVVSTFEKNGEYYLLKPERNIDEITLYNEINRDFVKNETFNHAVTGKLDQIKKKEKALENIKKNKEKQIRGEIDIEKK